MSFSGLNGPPGALNCVPRRSLPKRRLVVFRLSLAEVSFKALVVGIQKIFIYLWTSPYPTDLWMIGNVAMGLMDLFYGVNKGRDVIKFIDEFIPRLKDLEKQNNKLKAEMMRSPRFKGKKIISTPHNTV